MSERANLVLVNENGYSIFHSHAALVLDTYLFWGPEHALEFFKLHALSQKGLYDTVLAEGGALVDTTRKIVMLYGGEDIQLHIPRRRLYLQLMRYLWPGWTITWAMNGLFDLVDHLGVPQESIDALPSPSRMNAVITFTDPPEPENTWFDAVGSIRIETDDVRFVPASEIHQVLTYGAQIVPVLANTAKRKTLTWTYTEPEFPQSGFHIDVSQKQLWSLAVFAKGKPIR